MRLAGRALAVWAAGLLLALAARGQEGATTPASPARAAEPAPPAGDDAPAASLPPSLRGIDFDKPSQVAFKDWPPRELVERPYWFGWGPLTFQRAGVFGQPICLLLTVPWSHAEQLMRKGALADAEVLRTLNAGYFSILVRADRRPDIHARYGTGSWPAMSLLLPDGSPMLSKANPKGLALPITLGYAEKTAVLFHLNEGRKYFETWQNFLQGLAELYQKRVDVEEAKPGPVVADSLDVYTRWLLGNYDGKYGGFGAVPKLFPDGFMELAAERRDAGVGSLMAPARTTLVKWAASPLHDAVGGGFHRLAAAPNWGAIQYEKLLEVNAGIVRDLTLALRQQDDPVLRGALADTVRFITGTLAGPSGALWNAQAADPDSADGGGYFKAADRAAAKPPPIDRVVFSGADALAGAALIRAGMLLGDPSVEAAGRAALELVLDRAVGPGRGASHVVEAGEDIHRYLVTQADVALGFADAYETTGDRRYLSAAADLAAFVRNNLRAGKETAYRDHLSAGLEAGLLNMPFRPMVDNARLARVLIRLEAHGVVNDGRKEARSVLENYAGDLTLTGTRAIEAALAVGEVLFDPVEITIEGPPSSATVRALRREAIGLPPGWTVVKTAEAAKPGAEIAWRGKREHVDRPEDLAAAWKRLHAPDATR